MAVTFPCPACGVTLRVPPTQSTTKVICPECKQVVAIPLSADGYVPDGNEARLVEDDEPDAPSSGPKSESEGNAPPQTKFDPDDCLLSFGISVNKGLLRTRSGNFKLQHITCVDYWSRKVNQQVDLAVFLLVVSVLFVSLALAIIENQGGFWLSLIFGVICGAASLQKLLTYQEKYVYFVTIAVIGMGKVVLIKTTSRHEASLIARLLTAKIEDPK